MSIDSDSKDLKATRGAVLRKRYIVAPGFLKPTPEQVMAIYRKHPECINKEDLILFGIIEKGGKNG